MNDPIDQPDLPEPAAPKRLVDDLSAMYRAPGDVPAIVDHAIVARARRTLRPRRQPRWPLRLAGAGAAAAAAVVAVALWRADRPVGMAPQGAQVVAKAEDVNRDGAVDIVDAMLLARQVQAGEVDGSRDINGDGQVTAADADAIAMAAVRLTNRSTVQ